MTTPVTASSLKRMREHGPAPGEKSFLPLVDAIIKHESGMSRTVEDGKPDYTLISWELIDRWTVHMTKAVPSHGHNNWRKASTNEDYDRAERSAYRHFRQYMRGDTDEDHAAALIYNIGVMEMLKEKGIYGTLVSVGSKDGGRIETVDPADPAVEAGVRDPGIGEVRGQSGPLDQGSIGKDEAAQAARVRIREANRQGLTV